ncbi:MAG: RluA family pseudouridine synthase [Myxococcales bacterium]|nr:RluA family pseudouridine synthase [Myxococcales bacterium]
MTPSGIHQEGSEQPIVLRFFVEHEFAGVRLDRFVQLRIPRLSRTRAQAIIKACAFREDGSRRRPSDKVRAGETVLLVRSRFEEPDAPREFGIIYEDQELLIVDKPAGLPVHPSATYHRNTLTWLLKEQFPENPPRIVHRLDKETSGVLVCARSLASERALKQCFERRTMQKEYLAIVHGTVKPDEGRIELPMIAAPEQFHMLMRVCDKGTGLMALTDFKVQARGSRYSMLRLFPQTGRQHQLRVHLAALGHPIVGDKLYGRDGMAPFWEFVRHGMSVELAKSLGHWRHALHACTLRMPRLGTQAMMTWEAPFPEDLNRVWEEQWCQP